jgi:hypothetical protein
MNTINCASNAIGEKMENKFKEYLEFEPSKEYLFFDEFTERYPEAYDDLDTYFSRKKIVPQEENELYILYDSLKDYIEDHVVMMEIRNEYAIERENCHDQ